MLLRLLCILIIIVALSEPIIQYGGNPNSGKIFPFNNPFSKDFFNQSRKVYNVGARPRHYPLIKHVIKSYHVANNKSLYDLNNGNLDYVIDTELNIASLYNSSHTDIRFVCSLYAPSLLLISPNDNNIIDLGDIKHFSCDVSIAINGDRNSEQYKALTMILSMYPETSNVHIRTLKSEQILDGYGNDYLIYADLVFDNNHTIRALTDKVPSHLVSIKKVNTGDYFIRDSEKVFFKKYPYLNKDMIDIIQLQKNYPFLSQVHNRDLYYPTIKCRYILLSNTKISSNEIQRILSHILFLIQSRKEPVSKLFRDVTVTDISHMTIPIPIHKGATHIYKQLKLHS